MIVSEILTIVLAGFAGLLLGAIFFGGLWWTVRNGIKAKQPTLWFLVSIIARMGIALTGFYWVGGGQWPRLLSCLVGFIVARMIAVNSTRLWIANPYRLGKESDHAT
jgi:F1F0 ATPase subunit 2